MANDIRRWLGSVGAAFALVITALAAPARADEVWVAPTAQQDLGGLGIGSNVIWPATAAGVVRLAWSVPDNLQTFLSAKVVLIPHAPGGAAGLNIFVCPAEHSDPVAAGCAGPFAQAFTGVANQLAEVEIGGLIASHLGTPGATYLAVVAYTTPTTATDHIVGLRFAYVPKTPAGVATLAANTFSGTQTAPAFAGNGSGLTNLPFPAGAATLGANVFSGTQTAPGFSGSGAALTGVAKLAANTFSATQTINTGNLDLDHSTATTGNITKNGQPFVHDFGSGGSANVSTGFGAGNPTATNTGNGNSAIGDQALAVVTSGFANSAVGREALTSNTSGTQNTAMGAFALELNATGALNTATGSGALFNTTGGQNTGTGANALLNNTTGNGNVALGFQAGSAATTGSGNIYLGAQVTGVAGESNTMYLGRVGTQTKTFIAGVRGTTTVIANAIPVMIDSAGQLGTASSSVRFKEDIHDMADGSRRLLKLRPVTFRYRQAYADGSKPIQYGLIAEEVAAVFPELAVRGADGQVETVHYETLNVLLLNELQKQEQRAEQQDRRIEALEKLIAGLTKK